MEHIIHEWETEVRLSGEEAETICRLGKGTECCAFLMAGGHGFECIRMSYPMNITIFDRLEKGTMNAKGRGEWKGCPWHNDKEKNATA